MHLESTNPTLTATFTPEQVIFSGGKFGEHSLWLNVSPPERVQAHWEGYCEANDAKPVNPQKVLRVRNLTPAQVGWCRNALNTAGMDTDHDVTETATFGSTFVEGTREDLMQMVSSLVGMTGILEDDPCEAYSADDPESLPDWMKERLVEQAIRCCETAADKIVKVAR
jgi:hypothetical protein